MITFDLETYWDKDYSLSKLTTEAYIRDPRFQIIGVGIKVNDDEAKWYNARDYDIADILQQLRNNKVLVHNAAFDGAVLGWRYGIRPRAWFDTLSMSRPLSISGSLASLCRHFEIGIKGNDAIEARGKRLEDFTDEELAAYGRYCCNDVELTYKLFHVLKQYSTPKEMYIIDMMLRMYTEPILRLDLGQLYRHLQNVKVRKANLLLSVETSIDKKGLMSNARLADELLRCGVEPPMKLSPAAAKRGEEKWTYAFSKTDQEFTALLEHDHPFVQALVAARLGVKSTLEETRTQALIDIGGHTKEKVLPVMLNYYGAHTGRASGGDKVNPQNFPRGGTIRNAIYAPPGHILVVADSSQIEARTLAWLSGQFDLVGAFRKKVDIYCDFASQVYGRVITKADGAERFVGKTCILGLGYGTGGEKLRFTLATGRPHPVAITLDEARRIVQLYRETYSMIPLLWEQADNAINAMARGFESTFGTALSLLCTPEGVHLPNGMLLRYPELRKTKAGFVYRGKKEVVKLYGAKFVENVVQALARIIVFEQTARMDQHLRRLMISAAGWTAPDKHRRVVLSVHDEAVLCVPLGEHVNLIPEVEKYMSTPPRWAEGLPLACEIGYGLSYGTAK